MKLVRYGEKGAEKPGLIDKSGQLRDLSAHLKDLTGDAYAPESLRSLLPSIPPPCPPSPASRASAPRSPASRSSSRSA